MPLYKRKRIDEEISVPNIVEVLWGEVDADDMRPVLEIGRAKEHFRLRGPTGKWELNGNWKHKEVYPNHLDSVTGTWKVILYSRTGNRLGKREWYEIENQTARLRESDASIILGDNDLVEE